MEQLQSSEMAALGSAANGADWDRFAQRCDASFRGIHKASRIWKFEHGLFTKLLRLDIVLRDAGRPVKIGQCAIGMNRGVRTFTDALQLLPEYRHLWPQAMQSVLQVTGPGRFRYGSDWNVEPSRADELAGLNGVKLRKVHPVDILAVDFTNWDSWDAYYRQVSTNAKRNVKKAEKRYGDIRISDRQGLAIYQDVLPLQRARFSMFRRKSVASNCLSLIMRSSVRVLATSAYSTSTRMTADGDVVARYLGIDFGQTSFFLEAASGQGASGASSYLLKTMIERAFLRTQGKGVFVFGPDDHRQQGQPAWEGLVRSRLQWNAKPYPTAIISFDVKG